MYKKSEPEIIADAPHRLDPDKPYPIMILVKDAHLYPIELLSVKVTLSQNAKIIYSHTFKFSPEIKISTRYWNKIIEIHFSGGVSSIFGLIQGDVEIISKQNGKLHVTRNNNHRFTSKTSLKFFRSRTHLPVINNWIYGDAHTHSTYTEDQVEFGSPISATPKLCKAMGLSFFCVTDHSYDLDDTIDNYLLNDPEIPKWKKLQSEIDHVNSHENEFAVIRGEEVSCTNSNNSNVHFLLLGNRRFFHGSGDGGEKWFRTQSEYTIQEILSLKEKNVVTYASHPTEEVPFLQRLLLKRGEWAVSDMSEKELNGIQILNGETTESFFRGMDIWKWMLKRGEKKFLLAGNDAHGNFNRFVQISIPMLSFREKESQLFGKMKTALFTHEISEPAILEAIGKGRTVVTNGPLLTIEIETDSPDTGKIGETVIGNSFVVKLHAETTDEFGKLFSIKIFYGVIGKNEQKLFEVKEFNNPYSIHTISNWYRTENFSYIRAELFTLNAHGIDRDGFCYTNPIWIQPK
ncbi:MAG: CehA/McbA family metallohydrolase [Bacteroidota bacterium]|nr:CehA/McbA family metallohydrolase [Bacteroidota bacterium]